MLYSAINSIPSDTANLHMVVIFKDGDGNKFSISLNQEDIERNDLHYYLPSSSDEQDEGDIEKLCNKLFRIAEAKEGFGEPLDEFVEIEQVKILLNARYKLSGQPAAYEDVELVDLF